MNEVPDVREHQIFRRWVRRILDDRVRPYLDAWEAKGGLPYAELFPDLGGHGLLGLGRSPEHGGLGLDHRYVTIWAEELGRLPSGALPMALSVQTEIAMPLLEAAGECARRTFLPDAIAGRAVLAFAVTERAGGSDLGNIATTATARGDDLVLRGEKSWITNGSVADVLLIACRTGDIDSLADLSVVAVPAATPGVHQQPISGKVGNWACDHGIITLADVVVPRSHLIGRPGDGYALMSETFLRERRFLAVVAAAQARRILKETIVWAREHRVLGAALVDQQHVRFELAQLLADLDLIEAYLAQQAPAAVAGKLTLRSATMIKLRATELARRCADLALQLRGARAYLSEQGPARDVRDLRAGALAGGSDEALLHLLGGLLDTEA
jgi:citronellyl-CoA dehydrogenase/2,3-diaminopropionyl alpha,beta-desaturase